MLSIVGAILLTMSNNGCGCCYELSPAIENTDAKNLKCMISRKLLEYRCIGSVFNLLERDGPIDDNEPIND